MTTIDITLDNGTKCTLPTGIFYNNEFHLAKSGKTFPAINPATAKEIAQVQEAQEEDINEAVKAAKNCFENVMDDITPAQRGAMLNKFADAVEANQELLGAIESLDSGKPLATATSDDVGELIGVFRYYAGWTDKIHGKTIDTGKDRLAYTLHEPIGVCAAIIPVRHSIHQANLVQLPTRHVVLEDSTCFRVWKYNRFEASGSNTAKRPLLGDLDERHIPAWCDQYLSRLRKVCRTTTCSS